LGPTSDGDGALGFSLEPAQDAFGMGYHERRPDPRSAAATGHATPLGRRWEVRRAVRHLVKRARNLKDVSPVLRVRDVARGSDCEVSG
jgi:hypothetical protein